MKDVPLNTWGIVDTAQTEVRNKADDLKKSLGFPAFYFTTLLISTTPTQNQKQKRAWYFLSLLTHQRRQF